MTPDAVLQRYVQLANSEPVDVEALLRLVSADADLLGRWIALLGCRVTASELANAVHRLDPFTLTSLAQAQIWTVTPIGDSVRMSLEHWHKALGAACLGEALAEAMALPDPPSLRPQILLASSGVHVPQDPLMRELIEFRGSAPALLIDAHPALRILAVVEAHSLNGHQPAAVLAEQLLSVSRTAYERCARVAEDAALATVQELGIEPEVESDWAERLWLQQQIMAFSNVIALQPHAEGLNQVHRLIASELFGQVPKTFLLDVNTSTLAAPDEPELGSFRISLSDSLSVVAKSLRDRRALEQFDGEGAAVVDRQLMRRIGVDGLLAVPMVDDETAVGVMVFGASDETTPTEREVMEAYARSLGHWLAANSRNQRTLDGFVAEYRSRHEKRLREIVHEANNPLSIVHNYLHILELRLKEDANTSEQIRLIRDEITRTGDIIRRVTEFPDLDADTAPAPSAVSLVRANLNESIMRVCELIQPLAAARGVEVVMDLEPAPIVLETDTDRVTQILTNLVRNAIEAMSDGNGRVTVRSVSGVFRDGRRGVEFAVSDDGPGLPDDVLERLYQPKRSAKGGEHAGLGLHIVSQLVEDLEGSIDVRTSAERGTAFTVFLPLAPA